MKLNNFKEMLNVTWVEVSEVTKIKPSRLSDISKGKLPTTKEVIAIHIGTHGCVTFKDLVGTSLNFDH